MSITSDLLAAAPGLLAIGAGAGLLALFGRDPKADEHDLSDYHARSLDPERDELRERIIAGLERGGRPVLLPPDDILPPAPAGMNAGSPLYAETLFRHWRGGESPAAAAARMLREIAEDELAKAGIGPDGHAWQLDGSCWADCPGCAHDMTGAFPVVRAA